MSEVDQPLPLVWRHTWPDDEPKPDFVGQEAGYSFPAGRIFRADTHPGPEPKPWSWTLTGPFNGRLEIGETEGLAPTKADAVRAVTEGWARAKAWCVRTGEPMRWTGGHGPGRVPDGECLGTRRRG